MAATTSKWNITRAKRKLAVWVRRVDAEQVRTVKAYGAEAARQMVRYTPPAGGKVGVAGGLSRLKKRIKEDLMGDGGKVYTDADIVWRRDKQGRLFARFQVDGFAAEGHPSPFKLMRGKPSKKKLDALGVGSRRVEYVDNVRRHLRSSDQYAYRRRGSAVRLSWHGTRHVAALSDVRAEIKRRQAQAGSLMAGWKALARKSGAKLPPAVEKARGKGSAALRHSVRHRAVIEAHNRGNYQGLQVIVDRQVIALRKRLRGLARKEAKRISKKLK